MNVVVVDDSVKVVLRVLVVEIVMVVEATGGRVIVVLVLVEVEVYLMFRTILKRRRVEHSPVLQSHEAPELSWWSSRLW